MPKKGCPVEGKVSTITTKGKVFCTLREREVTVLMGVCKGSCERKQQKRRI